MEKYLFVGEERSPTAIKMDVTWRDKRLCAGHLSKAVESLGVKWCQCAFLNVYEDNIEDIKSFEGPVIGMGRKVERVLKNNDIDHSFIYHPATRGEVRNIDKYCNHFKNNLNHIIN